jgi:hypothetical protein
VKASTIDYYTRQAEAERARRHRDFQQSDGLMPLTMGWARYHPCASLVIVSDGFGRQRALTPIQHRVMVVARMHEGETVKATMIADSIGVATSTVTRALVRLAAFGLVAYDIVKGRYGGISILKRAWADLRTRSRTAWGKLKGERVKAWDRYLRRLDRTGYWWSGLNVASNRE